MKNIRLLIPALLIFLFSCRTSSDSNQVLEDIQENLDFGNLSTVRLIVDSLKNIKGYNNDILHIADSLGQIAERIKIDFSVSEDKFKSQIGDSATAKDLSEWDEKGWLEWRMIDGEKKYFNRAASNLFLLRKFHEHQSESRKETSTEKIFRLKHTTLAAGKPDSLSNPAAMQVKYTLTVLPDVVP